MGDSANSALAVAAGSRGLPDCAGRGSEENRFPAALADEIAIRSVKSGITAVGCQNNALELGLRFS